MFKALQMIFLNRAFLHRYQVPVHSYQVPDFFRALATCSHSRSTIVIGVYLQFNILRLAFYIKIITCHIVCRAL